MNRAQDSSPFTVRGLLTREGATPLRRAAEVALERISGLSELAGRYARLPASHGPQEFLRQAFSALDVRCEFPETELENIPREGAVVVVANHPFGGVEGMLLAQLLLQRRADVRIMANGLLRRIPELQELFIGVDPFGGAGAAGRNLRPLKEAVQWVQQGGLLAVFPAGAVSHLHLASMAITDPEWSDTIGRLIQRTGATVVPVHFQGANSWPFQAAGLVHPALRTALLPRELLSKKGRTLKLRIGQAVDAPQLAAFTSPKLLMDVLRTRTYELQTLPIAKASSPFRLPRPRPSRPAGPAAIQDGPARALLEEEIQSLADDQCLVDAGEMRVYCARAQQIPWLLQEIGRLREITFREAGEGTGKPVDLDLFDSYYIHLFIWNAARKEVVGAYRLGQADDILARYGKKGLYTYSLFKYKRRLLKSMHPALELGRSFVRKEYQRSFAPLLLLWKGIGQFILRHPHYRFLFGPVSISGEYHLLSRQLMVAFLTTHNFIPELAGQVKPRRPFRLPGYGRDSAGYDELGDIDGVSALVSKIEPDAKGVPILLKQYLKLGGRFLGFNVDRHFNNALDGLILVDLAQTDPRVLAKYMGREAADQFLEGHRAPAELRNVS